MYPHAKFAFEEITGQLHSYHLVILYQLFLYMNKVCGQRITKRTAATKVIASHTLRQTCSKGGSQSPWRTETPLNKWPGGSVRLTHIEKHKKSGGGKNIGIKHNLHAKILDLKYFVIL